MLLPTSILVVLNAILFVTLSLVTSVGNVKNRLLTFIALILLLVPSMVLNVYSVNCMLVGNCNLWSWIVTFISGIGILIACISVLAMWYQSKKMRSRNEVLQDSNIDEKMYKNIGIPDGVQNTIKSTVNSVFGEN